jgi:hypothetical protein
LLSHFENLKICPEFGEFFWVLIDICRIELRDKNRTFIVKDIL